MSNEALQSLKARLARTTEADNALDMEIDIALFRPDATYSSVRPNNAGTKLVYTLVGGGQVTHWAFDHTLNGDTRATALTLLSTLSQEQS